METQSGLTHAPQPDWRAVAIWSAAVVVCFAGVAFLAAVGIDLDRIARDSNETTDAPIETGALSRVGLILWGGAAAGAALVALVTDDRARREMFGLLALGLAGLGLDDALLIHEVVLPELGIPEKLVLAVWAVLAGLWLARYATRIRGTNRTLGVLALGAFAGSLAVDVLGHTEWLEDVFKTIGVATLVAIIAAELRAAVEDRHRR